MKKLIPYIKLHLKTIAGLAFVMMCVALISILIYSHYQTKIADKYQIIYNSRIDTIGKEINKNLDTVYLKTTKNIYNTPTDTMDKMRNLAAEVNVKDKELQRLTNINTQLNIKLSAKVDTVYWKDSIQYRQYSYNDHWISFKALAGDSLIFNEPLTIRDSITLFLTQKRVGNRYFKEARVINYNPYSTIKNIHDFDFDIPKEKSRWGIGLSGGITYWNGTIQPYVGFGLNYNLWQFNK